MDRPLTIGALARAANVSAKTIRYYEQVGVMPIPRRSPSGYRQYGRRDVHRLLFLRRARALGLSLQDLKSLAVELDQGWCGTMRPRLLDLVRAQLDAVQQRIVEFQLLQQQLDQVLSRLLTAAPSAPADESCQCLGRDAIPPPEGSQQPCTSVLGEHTMDTQQTLDTVTILPSTSSRAHEGPCGCGCECGVAQQSLTPVEHRPAAPRDHDDIIKGESA